MPPKHPWLGLIAFLVVCFAAAGIGGAVTTPKIAPWYATLAKPSWNPPNWVVLTAWLGALLNSESLPSVSVP